MLHNEYVILAETSWVRLICLAPAAVLCLTPPIILRLGGVAAPLALGESCSLIGAAIGAVALAGAIRAWWARRQALAARQAAALIWGQQPGTG